MKQMTRSGFRNVMIMAMIGLGGASLMAFHMAQTKRAEIDQLTMDLTSQKEELENLSRLSSALAELDKLTIDDTTATRLNILRHLGLEGADYDFQAQSKQIQQVGGASLILRMVTLKTELPYAESLALIDRLHNTKKMVINSVKVESSTKEGDIVNAEVMGTIYGLEKKNNETN